jgi:Gpi18-like mannosyltransferase
MGLSNRKKIILLFFFPVLYIIIGFLVKDLRGYKDDIDFWRRWAVAIEVHGLPKIYYTDSQYTYLPLFHYILYLYNWIMGSTEEILKNINYLRLFVFSFDCFALWIIYRWLERKVDLLLLIVMNTINLGFVYNTLIWGQVDGIGAAFAIASTYFLWKERYIWSCIFLLLAINVKFQSLIFAPLWGVLFLFSIIRRKEWWAILISLLVSAGLQLLILWPFLSDRDSLLTIWHIITESVDKFPLLSLNAMNFWYMVKSGDLFNVNDKEIFLWGITYKKAGLILFSTSYLLLLLPVAITLFKDRLATKLKKEQVFIMGALIALSFFYFNSQMHERYSLPAFVFIIAYSFYSRDFIPYILLSIASFLNLERVLRWLYLPNYDTLIFHPRFIASIFTILIIYLFVQLYRLSIAKPLE